MKTKLKRLSPREAEAADLLLLDLDFEAIGNRMGICTDQVKQHLKAARKKIGVRSRVGLALRWQLYRMMEAAR
jgi:DNA-binding CsgD family transcriptional regulator